MAYPLTKSPGVGFHEAPLGSWWITTSEHHAPGAVLMKCPVCGLLSTLRRPADWPRPDGTQGHQIAVDGSVSPSVVCPHQGCSFHEFVVLQGWAP